jgi:ligand-binding SRPBCC domain-containing protein
MRYRHIFKVKASCGTVTEFHRQAASLAAITPPPALVKIHQAPERLGEGDIIRFTIWMGPLPLRWTARIEQVNAQGFTDRQIKGPFKQWVHQHTFVPEGETETHVVDEIDYKLSLHLIWLPVGLLMGLSLPLLFAFRGWKTRKLLEGGKS